MRFKLDQAVEKLPETGGRSGMISQAKPVIHL